MSKQHVADEDSLSDALIFDNLQGCVLLTEMCAGGGGGGGGSSLSTLMPSGSTLQQLTTRHHSGQGSHDMGSHMSPDASLSHAKRSPLLRDTEKGGESGRQCLCRVAQEAHTVSLMNGHILSWTQDIALLA